MPVYSTFSAGLPAPKFSAGRRPTVGLPLCGVLTPVRKKGGNVHRGKPGDTALCKPVSPEKLCRAVCPAQGGLQGFSRGKDLCTAEVDKRESTDKQATLELNRTE